MDQLVLMNTINCYENSWDYCRFSRKIKENVSFPCWTHISQEPDIYIYIYIYIYIWEGPERHEMLTVINAYYGYYGILQVCQILH